MDKVDLERRREKAIEMYRDGYGLDEAAEENGFATSTMRTYIINRFVQDHKLAKREFEEDFSREWDRALVKLKGSKANISFESRFEMEWNQARQTVLKLGRRRRK